MTTRKRTIIEDNDADTFLLTSPHKRSKRDDSENHASSSSRFPRTPAAPIASTPISGWSSSSPAKTTKTPLTFPTGTPRKTPYTPYPSQPSDSPSNPFGRKRTRRLIHSLPPPSSFSKHAALRFQLVRTPKKGTSKSVVNAMALSHRQGGVHRIARVPLSYTFVHLRCLIPWLFNVPASYANNSGNGNHPPQDGNDYLFEVKNKIDIYGPLYKPGQIKPKSGMTVVKLSNVRDPARRWKSKFGFGLGDEDDEDEGEDELGEDYEKEPEEEEANMENDDDDDDDWKWADEEDFTIGHAFPQGLSGDIGIIYHHSPTTQVHITVNKLLLPRQRGISNTPFVFGARGYVHLSPAPLPRPLFSKSIFDILSSSPASSRAVKPPQKRGAVSVPVAFPSRGLKALFVAKAKEEHQPLSKAKAKSKSEVRLKSPTPPPRKAAAAARKLMTKKFNSPPLPPPQAAMDEDLTDTDADGERDHEYGDEDEFENDLHKFDATHPFFYAQGSSPFNPVADELEEEEEEERPEVIYIADSDEEPQREEEEHEVIEISDSEESCASQVADEDPSSKTSSLSYHLREDQNRLMDTEKFNDPPYLFAKYLLEYMDPRAYANVREAIRRGELDEAEAFLGDNCKEEDDPFDEDEEDVKVVKGKGKEELKRLERGKQRKVEVEEEQDEEEEEEEEDEDMEPSLHVIEDDDDEGMDDEEVDEEEEGQVQFQVKGDSQTCSGSGLTPGLTNATSIPSPSSLPPSSPPRPSSPSFYSSNYNLSTASLPDILLSSEIILSEHYPNKKYTFTPAPPRGRTKRIRIERLERRLKRAKRGDYLSKYDEKEVEDKEEVDELADDDVDGEEEEEEETVERKSGEVWDPFGDEEEL